MIGREGTRIQIDPIGAQIRFQYRRVAVHHDAAQVACETQELRADRQQVRQRLLFELDGRLDAGVHE